MSQELVRFSATIPEDLLEQFDEYAARRGTGSNRSEAIRDLMRERLVSEAMISPKEPVVGSITMVYSHHAGDVTNRLDEIQHEHNDLIMSTMHIHLDHDNCLEILAVHGCGVEVYALADKLLGQRGVRYGALSLAATDRQIKGEAAVQDMRGHTHSHMR